ncbi:MAG: hypothetical protein WC476_01035 [Phycisphaerae bacterium]
MVYDTFMFFNELDILELRLKELNDVVDRFVLAESISSHSGNEKPLYYESNKDRFSQFQDKIIHVVVEDYPKGTSFISWDREHHQRNAIIRGLSDVKDDDYIMLSDVDEIPRPSKIGQEGVFITNLYGYYINVKCGSGLSNATVGIRGKNLKELLPLQKLRETRGDNITPICNGGWHFSYLGNPDEIKAKLDNYAHTEYSGQSIENVRKNYENLQSPYSEEKWYKCDVDDTYPKTILENLDYYSKYIL